MTFTEYHPLIDEAYSAASAAAVLPSVFGETTPASVIDFGCGTGAWLDVCQSLGVLRMVGVDGPGGRAPTEMIHADLSCPLSFGRYDLALCLEVVEHLPESSADVIVATLIESSDRILFSAATPGQGGAGHINEQPHTYWDERFTAAGFFMSPVDVSGVPAGAYWYSNNMRLYVKESPVVLTIIVPTIPGRESMLSRLLHGLESQMVWAPDVEVVVVDGVGQLGDKVGAGLAEARGRFSVIVDDDDELAADYVPEVLRAANTSTDADFIGYRIQWLTDGRWSGSISHRHDGDPLWESEPRGAGPKCPFRTTIGRRYVFGNDYTADRRWSVDVHNDLREGLFIDRHLYRYDHRPGGSAFTGQGGGEVGMWPYDPTRFRWVSST